MDCQQTVVKYFSNDIKSAVYVSMISLLPILKTCPTLCIRLPASNWLLIFRLPPSVSGRIV